MSRYLCYDIRGIQTFIFRIPKLRYIIGGSALIDQFDRKTIPGIQVSGCTHLFSGGGKGTFICGSAVNAAELKGKIANLAHAIGLDIRFGENEDFAEAGRNAVELFPYSPNLEGKVPCPVSGLYPVTNADPKGHPIIRKRTELTQWFEKSLMGDNFLYHPALSNKKVEFFHNVDAEDKEDRSGGIAAKALGSRNRWAVICMDGNDMGLQLRHMTEKQKLTGEALKSWVQAMSLAIDSCAREAAKAGIQQVVSSWAATGDFDEKQRAAEPAILPIRPLVVGGDDIAVICHVSHAMTFVKEAIRVFNEVSIAANTEFKKKSAGMDLWPATGGELTISAGVFFCPVSLPLHTAMEYAESLLASAKGRGRKAPVADKPSPACIDWEQVTDSIVDTPSARRQREFIFEDTESKSEVVLTSRPCTLEEFTKIEKLAEQYDKIPPTVRHKILPSLRMGFSDRLAFVAEIAKNHPVVAGHLSEKGYEIGTVKSQWVYSEDTKQKKTQTTTVIDALLILEEAHRMEKESANA